MDTHEVIDALRHLISSLHLDTVAGAAIAGTVLAGGLYVGRLCIRRQRSAAAVAHERPSPVHIDEFDGTETLFIMPDISGYTKLLSAAGRDRAAPVNKAVIMLLDALMQSAKGRLTVAKLEGDAILFFADADKLTPNDVGDILLDLFCAFDTTKRRLVLDTALPSKLLDLELKVAVHCGHAERFTFRNAIDLLGADVVLTYRLLKSGLKQRRYILSTSNASERFMLPDNYTRQHLRKHIPEFGDTGLVLIDMPRDVTVPRGQKQSSRQTIQARAVSIETRADSAVKEGNEIMTTRSPMLTTLALALGVGLLATLSTVHAHKGATGVVMERMMSMKSMGDGMKNIAAMVTGKAPYDATKTKAIAAEINKHAAGIPEQFPKGSIKGPSEALPAIWKDWDAFKGHADELAKLADQLSASADTGKVAALGLFAQMGKTCSVCHQDYRKKKE